MTTANMQDQLLSPDVRPSASGTSSSYGPVIDVVPTRYLHQRGFYRRCFALLLLAISGPVIAILVVLVRLGSRGPGVYSQVRVGQHGKIFVMYKIRSMVQDAEENTGPVWTQDDNDPRITLIGRFLRKSHLDELPQLWNVVKGEMALFGPRPERPELIQALAGRIPGYLNRLAVQPGITGLAQINLPPDTDVESVRRKLQLDMEYVKHANFGLNLRMFGWTCLRLVGVSASCATHITNLGRQVVPVKTPAETPVTIKGTLTTNIWARSEKTSAQHEFKAAPRENQHPRSDSSWRSAETGKTALAAGVAAPLAGGSRDPIKTE